jgi:hypothetical protein
MCEGSNSFLFPEVCSHTCNCFIPTFVFHGEVRPSHSWAFGSRE